MEATELEKPMKLNFWQWLGVVLLVVGLIWLLYARRDREATTTPAPGDVPATTAPAP
jgi:hypothetical protein